jgi:hypothetical protein
VPVVLDPASRDVKAEGADEVDRVADVLLGLEITEPVAVRAVHEEGVRRVALKGGEVEAVRVHLPRFAAGGLELHADAGETRSHEAEMV